MSRWFSELKADEAETASFWRWIGHAAHMGVVSVPEVIGLLASVIGTALKDVLTAGVGVFLALASAVLTVGLIGVVLLSPITFPLIAWNKRRGFRARLAERKT